MFLSLRPNFSDADGLKWVITVFICQVIRFLFISSQTSIHCSQTRVLYEFKIFCISNINKQHLKKENSGQQTATPGSENDPAILIPR